MKAITTEIKGNAMGVAEKAEAVFWMNVDQTCPEGCWPWTRRMNGGYGSFSHNRPGGGRVTRAHRYSYELFYGPIPDGLCVCHSCDNMACVNPAHLWAGTLKENHEDMRKKLRHTSAISPDKEERIRALLRQGMSHKFIADNCGCARSTVETVKQRFSCDASEGALARDIRNTRNKISLYSMKIVRLRDHLDQLKGLVK